MAEEPDGEFSAPTGGPVSTDGWPPAFLVTDTRTGQKRRYYDCGEEETDAN